MKEYFDVKKYDTAQIILKSFQFCSVVLEEFRKSKEAICDSTSFGPSYDAGLGFQTMPPAANNYIPLWMRADRHRQRITTSEDPSEFWENVSEEF